MNANESGFLQHQFVLRCAFIAGKVIDRNIAPDNPSFAHAMDLDEQMDAIAASMPDGWWDTQNLLLSPDLQPDQHRERLLQQFCFFHVRFYVHLPFIMKSRIASPFNHSRLACME